MQLQQQGAWNEAGLLLATLFDTYPEQATVHRAMALQLSHAGQNDLAIKHMEIACRLAPASAEFGFQLGCLQAHEGHTVDALERFRATTRHLPDFADGWYLLGITLVSALRDAEALPILRTAYQLAPDQIKIIRALADLEFKIGFPDDALPLWQELKIKQPENVHVSLRLGETLSRLGFHDQAAATYRQALTITPHEADLWVALAQAEEDNGNRTGAAQAYEKALELKPDWAFPISGLLSLQRTNAPAELMDLAMRLQQSLSLPDPDRALLGYELGKVHDSQGNYETAMTSWNDANAARQRVIGKPDPIRLEKSVDRTIALFQPELFRRFGQVGDISKRFVFIVGMPRSGTTLTEQILASHPQAYGCGELPDVSLIAHALGRNLGTHLAWPEAVASLTEHVLEESISRYRRAAARHAPATAHRLVDKAPLNFLYLGLMALMFPNAKVIWCRRDPRDIAISIYGENFSVLERLATSLEGIGHYINLQNKLMRYWQELNLPIMELSYEALVSNTETEAKNLLSFIELPWDPKCLEFHKSDRGVQTPSRWQVKQPVHSRSIGRWRNYASALAPLLSVLDIDANQI